MSTRLKRHSPKNKSVPSSDYKSPAIEVAIEGPYRHFPLKIFRHDIFSMLPRCSIDIPCMCIIIFISIRNDRSTKNQSR